MASKKWKTLIVLLLLLSITLILSVLGIYNKQKRYVEKDMEQFISEVNYSIIDSTTEINRITKKKEEVFIDSKDIKLLTFHERRLRRSIFDFMEKTRFIINSELGDDFRQLWDDYNFNEQMSAEDIRLYYDQLSERTDGKERILLNANDVNMLQEILDFYRTARKDINNLVAE